MPESFITALDDRCFALENFVETTGTQNAPWHGHRPPPSTRNVYGRSQATVADGDRLKAAIFTIKVQDVDLPSSITDDESRVTKQRGKRARAKSEGNEEPQKRIPSPRKGSSAHYGVRFRPDLRKWVAEIRVAEWKDVDKKVWLGTFDTEEGAARGVDLARKLLKCTKTRPANLPCRELDLYSTKIPPHLDLTDIANDAMVKDVVLFIKNESRSYAARFPPTTPVLTHPQPQPTPNPNVTPLGYEEVDVGLWNDDTYELGLSDSELLIPQPRSDHLNADPTVHPNGIDVLLISDLIDMHGIFEQAFPPFREFDSSSPGSSAPSSFTAQEFQFQTFQVQQNEIARGASPDQRQPAAAAWEMDVDVELEPVCHNLAAACNLPQTWPGVASPSTREFPIHSGLQSEQVSLDISPEDMTFFDVANHWSMQSEQFQFQMDISH